jgi:large subunit ribosomal protein LP2
MRYIAGYLLAVLGGNENPSTADVSAILSAAGVNVDQESLKMVHSQCAGKNLDELIAAGALSQSF